MTKYPTFFLLSISGLGHIIVHVPTTLPALLYPNSVVCFARYEAFENRDTLFLWGPDKQSSICYSFINNIRKESVW